MLIRKLEEFEQMSMEQRLAVGQNIILCPAMGTAIWFRPDIGGRVMAKTVGLCALAMILFSLFLLPSTDKFLFFYGGWATAFLGMVRRFQRWRDHRRGVRQHSYYLGTSEFSFRWLPRFLRKNRRIEKNFDGLFLVGLGIFLLPYAQYFGFWLMIAGSCLGTIEHSVAFREYNQELDLVDGMVKSEVQTQTVEHFAEPEPISARPHDIRIASIPTGVGADIAAKIKENSRRK